MSELMVATVIGGVVTAGSVVVFVQVRDQMVQTELSDTQDRLKKEILGVLLSYDRFVALMGSQDTGVNDGGDEASAKLQTCSDDVVSSGGSGGMQGICDLPFSSTNCSQCLIQYQYPFADNKIYTYDGLPKNEVKNGDAVNFPVLSPRKVFIGCTSIPTEAYFTMQGTDNCQGLALSQHPAWQTLQAQVFCDNISAQISNLCQTEAYQKATACIQTSSDDTPGAVSDSSSSQSSQCKSSRETGDLRSCLGANKYLTGTSTMYSRCYNNGSLSFSIQRSDKSLLAGDYFAFTRHGALCDASTPEKALASGANDLTRCPIQARVFYQPLCRDTGFSPPNCKAGKPELLKVTYWIGFSGIAKTGTDFSKSHPLQDVQGHIIYDLTKKTATVSNPPVDEDSLSLLSFDGKDEFDFGEWIVSEKSKTQLFIVLNSGKTEIELASKDNAAKQEAFDVGGILKGGAFVRDLNYILPPDVALNYPPCNDGMKLAPGKSCSIGIYFEPMFEGEQLGIGRVTTVKKMSVSIKLKGKGLKGFVVRENQAELINYNITDLDWLLAPEHSVGRTCSKPGHSGGAMLSHISSVFHNRPPETIDQSTNRLVYTPILGFHSKQDPESISNDSYKYKLGILPASPVPFATSDRGQDLTVQEKETQLKVNQNPAGCGKVRAVQYAGVAVYPGMVFSPLQDVTPSGALVDAITTINMNGDTTEEPVYLFTEPDDVEYAPGINRTVVEDGGLGIPRMQFSAINVPVASDEFNYVMGYYPAPLPSRNFEVAGVAGAPRRYIFHTFKFPERFSRGGFNLGPENICGFSLQIHASNDITIRDPNNPLERNFLRVISTAQDRFNQNKLILYASQFSDLYKPFPFDGFTSDNTPGTAPKGPAFQRWVNRGVLPSNKAVFVLDTRTLPLGLWGTAPANNFLSGINQSMNIELSLARMKVESVVLAIYYDPDSARVLPAEVALPTPPPKPVACSKDADGKYKFFNGGTLYDFGQAPPVDREKGLLELMNAKLGKSLAKDDLCYKDCACVKACKGDPDCEKKCTKCFIDEECKPGDTLESYLDRLEQRYKEFLREASSNTGLPSDSDKTSADQRKCDDCKDQSFKMKCFGNCKLKDPKPSPPENPWSAEEKEFPLDDKKQQKNITYSGCNEYGRQMTPSEEKAAARNAFLDALAQAPVPCNNPYISDGSGVKPDVLKQFRQESDPPEDPRRFIPKLPSGAPPNCSCQEETTWEIIFYKSRGKKCSDQTKENQVILKVEVKYGCTSSHWDPIRKQVVPDRTDANKSRTGKYQLFDNGQWENVEPSGADDKETELKNNLGGPYFSNLVCESCPIFPEMKYWSKNCADSKDPVVCNRGCTTYVSKTSRKDAGDKKIIGSAATAADDENVYAFPDPTYKDANGQSCPPKDPYINTKGAMDCCTDADKQPTPPLACGAGTHSVCYGCTDPLKSYDGAKLTAKSYLEGLFGVSGGGGDVVSGGGGSIDDTLKQLIPGFETTGCWVTVPCTKYCTKKCTDPTYPDTKKKFEDAPLDLLPPLPNPPPGGDPNICTKSIGGLPPCPTPTTTLTPTPTTTLTPTPTPTVTNDDQGSSNSDTKNPLDGDPKVGCRG